MTISMHPDITCTRCGTVVPWGPYCPHCVAYLEFAGEPPWAPDVPDAEAQAPVLIEEPLAELAALGELIRLGSEPSEDIEPSVMDLESGAEPVEPAPTALIPEVSREAAGPAGGSPVSPSLPLGEGQESAHDSSGPRRIPWYRPTPEQRRGYVASGVLSGFIVLVIAVVAGWSTLFVTIPVIMGWALASGWLFFVEDEHAEDHQDHEEETSEEVAPEEVASQEVAPAEAGGLEARAPQLVDAVVVNPHGSTISRATTGNTPCPTCGNPNGAIRRYCDWCGGVMEGATLSPSTVAALGASEDDGKPEKGKKRKGRRSPSRSWRQALLAGGVGLVLISTLLVAFFGPGALRFRGGITTVYQQISQWLNPFTGQVQAIDTVTSTSTLPGMSPDLAAGGDVRTFWASDTSPGFGIGTVLTYNLADASPINRMVIYPGIQGPQFDSRALATPKQITLTFDDGTSITTVLLPVDDERALTQLVEFPAVGTQTVTMTIDSVYPPRGALEGDLGEVAISGTTFIKLPPPPPLFGIQQGVREPKLPGLRGSTSG